MHYTVLAVSPRIWVALVASRRCPRELFSSGCPDSSNLFVNIPTSACRIMEDGKKLEEKGWERKEREEKRKKERKVKAARRRGRKHQREEINVPVHRLIDCAKYRGLSAVRPPTCTTRAARVIWNNGCKSC